MPMILDRQLTGETVRAAVKGMLQEHLSLHIDGYKCNTALGLDVLVKAALEGQTIESIGDALDLAVGSNAIQEQLNQALEGGDLRVHERELNCGLAACLPAELPRRRREMALDWHDEPFYGKTPALRMYACRGAAKEGTTYFYRLASLYVIWRQVRITLALTYVLPGESNLAVVQRLVARMQQLGFWPGVLYMDKEFCEGAIVRYLTQANLPDSR
jgi:hypothetical protein